MTIVICFALLNPLVIPFALVYFSVESGMFLSFSLSPRDIKQFTLVIVKHQVTHVATFLACADMF